MLPKPCHTEVLFLPPNTTSKLQPMDAGIIAAVNMRYRRRQLERALDFIDLGEVNIYNIDQLTAMRWLKTVWEELPGHVIFNCWKHTILLNEKLTASTIDSTDNASTVCAEGELQNLVDTLVTPVNQMSIMSLINAEDPMECTEEFSEDIVVQGLIEEIVNKGDGESDGVVDDEASIPMPSVTEQLRAIAQVKRLFEVHPEVWGAGGRTLNSLQRTVRIAAANSLRQSRIDSFFGNN